MIVFREQVAWVLGALILVAMIASVWWFGFGFGPRYSEAETIAKGVRTFDELSERFRVLAQDKGARYAFEVLGSAPLPPNTDIHLLGHVVGDELYAQEGVGGIAFCTQDFRNACSHSIVIGALGEFGETALPSIREACVRAPGGPGAYTMCYHGLGHGVFAYFGYSIPETVAFCEKTGTDAYNNREAIECIGGMIMELMGGGGHDRDAWQKARERYLASSDPLRVCMDDVIPYEAKSTCLAYLTPFLWERAGIDIGNPNPETFPAAFKFCDQVPAREPELRASCFGGFGKEFVPLVGARDVRALSSYADEQFKTIYTWCSSAGHTEGIAACITDALASFFWGGENDPAVSFGFCNVVEQQDAGIGEACFAALTDNVVSYVSGDVRLRLCARLPEKYQAVCMR